MKRRLMKLAEISDRRSTDRVERQNGKLYLIDTTGFLAPVQIQDEETEGLPLFLENTAKMPGHKIGFWADIVKRSAMTPEGKRGRLAALTARWRELYGAALFVVTE